jgi:hypothetical protein
MFERCLSASQITHASSLSQLYRSGSRHSPSKECSFQTSVLQRQMLSRRADHGTQKHNCLRRYVSIPQCLTLRTETANNVPLGSRNRPSKDDSFHLVNHACHSIMRPSVNGLYTAGHPETCTDSIVRVKQDFVPPGEPRAHDLWVPLRLNIHHFR